MLIFSYAKLILALFNELGNKYHAYELSRKPTTMGGNL